MRGSTDSAKTVCWPPGGFHAPGASATLVQGAAAESSPKQIGRYRVERLLGEGSFGRVYLAHDDQLQRCVAIKVPHPHLVRTPESAAAYLAEARTLAGLSHPHVVAVYDVGATPEFACYIVSAYVPGRTLARRIKESRLSFAEAAELTATVADALHAVHKRGIVHRDIKPGNILLDKDDRPHVVDFGLALRETESASGPAYVGTPAYMSPEQARGEGHRVDGRSDVYSLGAVLYELLAGHRPFPNSSRTELLEDVATREPKPPRQIDEHIPRELERICLKTLSKRACDRYTNASDLAEDLRHFLSAFRRTASEPQVSPDHATTRDGGTHETSPTARPAPPDTASSLARVVPKGLRSFDERDSDFFLELLPGPRDRQGLPDTIRLLKDRLEETDADETFAVGLVYGASGCGKSSLVKAGLLPRLGGNVSAIYIEASGNLTERRLLHRLQKCFPGLSQDCSLKESLAKLRRQPELRQGRKVLLVLDQFEQWLHSGLRVDDAELVQALRQCDGPNVQCLVLVRDDFWMAVGRFMRDLEVVLVEGFNSVAIDRFPPRHAEKVLTALGRAFSALPDMASLTTEQRTFVSRAVECLQQDDQVNCVRLALFAEMMKGKPWVPQSLQKAGGAEGIGSAFLEETFSSPSAPPEHRYHERAARAVLESLLPQPGTDIRGRVRSSAELLEVSGYADRPKEFDRLIGLLDGELRLITPSDPWGLDPGDGDAPPPHNAQPCYQLTHDYLVPSLRDWLLRKRRGTLRGRVEMRLDERCALWSAKPEPRQLPSLGEWLGIQCLTRRRGWTTPQRKMMRAASRRHFLRVAAVSILICAAFAALLSTRAYVRDERSAVRAAGLVQRLMDAETAQVPSIVAELDDFRTWADPALRARFEEVVRTGSRREQLHASLGLLPGDLSQLNFLSDRLLNASDPMEAAVIISALRPYRDRLTRGYWDALKDPASGSVHLPVAAALAAFDSSNPEWRETAQGVAEQLVSTDARFLGLWLEQLRPISSQLQEPLRDLFNGPGDDQLMTRSLAAAALAEYRRHDPQALIELLEQARDEPQFRPILAELKRDGARSRKLAQEALARCVAAEATGPRAQLRAANLAVALLELGSPAQCWALLRHRSDPTLRSWLIHQIANLGISPRVLQDRLSRETDVSIRHALILALGEYSERQLPTELRAGLCTQLADVWRHDPDPGVHSAAEWAHGRLGGALPDEPFDLEVSAGSQGAARRWYTNRAGQTMAIVPGQQELQLDGLDSHGRGTNQVLRVTRSFAISTTEVSNQQFRRFLQSQPNIRHSYTKRFSPDADGPVISVSWFAAAAYCRWLSELEGIPEHEMCFPPISEIGEGMRMPEDYLSRSGYRLPTEAEWEFASRAGTTTHWHFGDAEELLAKYAWYVENSSNRAWSVGRLKPNEFGLFDTSGNVWEWCLNPFQGSRGVAESLSLQNTEEMKEVRSGREHVLRGGSCGNAPPFVSCVVRDSWAPDQPNGVVGFRLARTLPTATGSAARN